MKSVVFNLLEEVVSNRHGEAVRDRLLESTGPERSCIAPGNNPDEGMDHDAMPPLARRHPALFAVYGSSRDFVPGLFRLSPPHGTLRCAA